MGLFGNWWKKTKSQPSLNKSELIEWGKGAKKPPISAEARAEREMKKAVSLGITHYIVRTCEDSRVCPECAERNGNAYPYRNAQIGKNLPPLHDGCRCYAEPVIKI